MDENDLLAERFQVHRGHLRAVAYRMLGTSVDADDAVQEAWFRLSRSDTADVENLRSWLTTVVARVCLDVLRARRSRPEEPVGTQLPEPRLDPEAGTDPESEALLADSVAIALLVVLETLAPAERLAFVLHDLFAVPFDEIAPIVDRSPAAARQLASRARRRVQGSSTPAQAGDTRHREIVGAFLAASRDGDFAALLTLLDPEVVFRIDQSAAPAGAPRWFRGAAAVAGRATNYSGRARLARVALVNGAAGIVLAPPGRPPFLVLTVTIVQDRIVELDLLADADRLAGLDLLPLD